MRRVIAGDRTSSVSFRASAECRQSKRSGEALGANLAIRARAAHSALTKDPAMSSCATMYVYRISGVEGKRREYGNTRELKCDVCRRQH